MSNPPVARSAQGAAEEAVLQLTPAQQQALCATVIQNLDTPQQQKTAAEGVIGALPTEAKQDLVRRGINSLTVRCATMSHACGALGVA
jgi:hypothetical protein